MPHSYGLQLGVEGSVVGLFVFGWWDHREGRVESAVVVSVDPAGGGVLDVGDGLVGPVVEDRSAEAFGLVQADHGFP